MVDSWGVVYKIDVRSGTVRQDRVEDGPQARQAGPQPRRRAVGQSGDFGHRLCGPRDRDRQGDRPGGLGQEPARPGGPRAHRRAARAQGRDPGRRLRRRPRLAQLARGARSQDRRHEVEDLFDPGAGRARQRDLEGQEQRLADRRRLVLRHRRLRSGQQSDLLGIGQSGPGLRFVVPPGRQSLHVERHRVQRDQRQDHVVAPIHAERQSRLRRDRRPRPDRYQDQRRGPQDRLPCRAATASPTASTASTASSSRPPSTSRR